MYITCLQKLIYIIEENIEAYHIRLADKYTVAAKNLIRISAFDS